MDQEDISRVLNQLWWDYPELFIQWFKDNQSAIMNHLSEERKED